MASKSKLPRRGSNEGAVQADILDYLETRGHCFFRVNNIPAFSRAADGSMRMRLLPKHTPRGLPDIIVVRRGWFVALEVKDKGSQSADQKAFQRRVEAAGGRYHLVRSIQDVQQAGL